MGSDDDMFRIWSGPEGSSHKEPLSGIRIHRAHGLSFCAVLPNRAMLDAARHPKRQFVIQKARHDQKVYALPFSCQLVRSGRRSLFILYLRRFLAPDAIVIGDVLKRLVKRDILAALGTWGRSFCAGSWGWFFVAGCEDCP